jgi:hypothetical protein
MSRSPKPKSNIISVILGANDTIRSHSFSAAKSFEDNTRVAAAAANNRLIVRRLAVAALLNGISILWRASKLEP